MGKEATNAVLCAVVLVCCDGCAGFTGLTQKAVSLEELARMARGPQNP